MRSIVAVAAAFILARGVAARAATDPEHEAAPAQFSALYTADALWNVHGGLRGGAAYLDCIEVAAGLDADRALGWHDLAFYASAIRRNDPTFSDRYVGDAMIVSNIDATSPMQVLEAWLEQGFDARGPGSLRVGLYDLSAEFDAIESRSLFLNSAYGIGQDLAQTGSNGPSIYPVTALGARLAWAPRDAWLLKTAVLDGEPGDPEERGRSRLHLSSSEGALWITEATAGSRRVRGGVGYWRYTADFPQLQLPDADGMVGTRNDNAGGYAMAEFASADAPGTDEPRWLAFLRAGVAEDHVNVFDRFLAAGAVYRSPWPGHHGSHLGLAIAEAHIGDAYRELRAADGLATDASERNLELTWRFPLGAHAALQPDLQYVQNPSGDPQLPDVWVVGLRVELFATW
jgi:porin